MLLLATILQKKHTVLGKVEMSKKHEIKSYINQLPCYPLLLLFTGCYNLKKKQRHPQGWRKKTNFLVAHLRCSLNNRQNAAISCQIRQIFSWNPVMDHCFTVITVE